MSLLHQRPECREVGFLNILCGSLGVKFMTLRLGTAVHREMLRAGGSFKVLSIALESADVLNAKPGSQVWILAVGFVSPAPSRVAEYIYVRRPQR